MIKFAKWAYSANWQNVLPLYMTLFYKPISQYSIMYQRQVSFKEAVERALKQNYCNFSGRASRSEFWWFVLFNFILSAVISIVFCWSQDTMNVITGLVNLALLLPSLGLAVRRLHDIGKSGWWIFISLIPIVGWILLIVWYCKDSQMETNEYGPVPNMVQ